MNRTGVPVTLALGLFLCGCGAAVLIAGPLDPPSGPVAPTYKSLTEVEPRIAINATNTPGDANSLFRITQPGSYYLTGNVTGEPSKHGIEIAVSGVTLDLNGFELNGGFATFDGITTSAATLGNITVTNGFLRNWNGTGVNFGVFATANSRIVGVKVSGSTSIGIYAGVRSTVADCSVDNNGSFGIHTGGGCIISDCVASRNEGRGISASSGTIVSGCKVIANLGDGIYADGSSSISNCSATVNEGDGIYAGTGTTVSDCVAGGNDASGIVALNHCVLRGNTCHGNGERGGAGIRVSGSNRLEGNNCTDSDRGFSVEGEGNMIIANTCRNNRINWSVVAGNRCLVVEATAAGAINGNSGGVNPGSTNPWANFTY